MVVQYAGSRSWDQNQGRGINTLPLVDSAGSYATRQGVATGTLNANPYRNYPGFANIHQEENAGTGDYNSLQAGVRIENRWGLTTQVAYTWSHEIDLVSGDLNSVSNPYNMRYDRGSGTGFDRRHIFNVSYIYNFPWFSKSSNVAARSILGGWSVSGITVAQRGVPQYIRYTGSDTLGMGGDTNNRPDQVKDIIMPKKQNAWFDKTAFADPKAPWAGGLNQGWGTAGKDSVVGPGLFNWNLSLFKSIQLTSHEGPKIELRFESFNTFNNTSWTSIDTGSHDGNFGKVTGAYDPRTLQLGGKFVF